MTINGYEFDRFLRYDEMSAWLYAVAAKYPDLVRVESYGKSHAGRDLLLATITEIASGGHATTRPLDRRETSTRPRSRPASRLCT